MIYKRKPSYTNLREHLHKHSQYPSRMDIAGVTNDQPSIDHYYQINHQACSHRSVTRYIHNQTPKSFYFKHIQLYPHYPEYIHILVSSPHLRLKTHRPRVHRADSTRHEFAGPLICGNCIMCF